MKIRTKRIFMLLLLLAGIILNCLSAGNVLPLRLSVCSVVAVSGYSFMVIFVPLLFPGITQGREISTYMHDLTAQVKRMSVVTICLAVVWVLTFIACIAHPL